MNSQTLTVTDLFDAQYQIMVFHMQAPHPLATPVNISRVEDVYIFLRRFNLNRTEWSVLLYLINCNTVRHQFDDIVNTLSLHLLKNRIRIFRLPGLGQCLAPDKTGSAYAFIRGPAFEQANTAASQCIIDSASQAKTLIEGLDQDTGFWNKVLKQNDLGKGHSNPADQQDILNRVYKNLLSKELLVYKMPYKNILPEIKEIASEEPATIVPSTLGPHVGQEEAATKKFSFMISS